MRKSVKFERVVRLMVPIWHQPGYNTGNKNQLKYKRPMAVLELIPNKEYNCADLQALLNRGAEFTIEDYTYVCSCGFVPEHEGLPLISPVSTGLDPEGELN